MRIGELMASLFATVPAWRQLDPLHILPDKGELGHPGKWLEEEPEPESAPGPGRLPEASTVQWVAR